MTLFQIVGLYVGLNLLILPVMMLRVGSQRMSKNINLGHGEDPKLLSRIRAHGNYAENTPFALIGLMAMAMLSAPPVLLHAVGIAFTLGRLLHAYGMAGKNAVGKGRVSGMILTLLCYLIMGAYLLYRSIIG